MADYFRPTTLEAALAALPEGRWTPLAGGTDVYPARAGAAAWGTPADEALLDITGLAELCGIEETAAGHRLGALVTWTELVEAVLPPWFDGLRLAGREVGGRQIQNRGTLAGNLCNASPAADGVPPLLTLDAEVELASLRGRRRLPLSAFIVGNRRTARATDELLVAVHVPRPRQPRSATFLKLGARRHLVISIVMAAGLLEAEADGTVRSLRLAVGACSAAARRLPALEAVLAGRSIGPALADLVTPDHMAPLAPIDDVRASAGYRREAALELVRRAIAELAGPGLERAA